MPNTLDDNMKVGLKVVQLVRKEVPSSMNYESTSSPVNQNNKGFHTATPAQAQKFQDIHQKVVEKIQGADYTAFWKRSTNRTLVREVHNIIQGCETGNCLELAFYTAHKLRLENKTADIVVVDSPTAAAYEKDTKVIPHWFTVIGRTNGSNNNKTNIGLPSTWGASAVIVDSWDTSVYPAAKFNTFWDGLKAAASNKPLSCKLWVRI